ncbi:MAG: cofactor-independent phosphoglycerate mutase [Bacteroidaceae bacterium]|nr:cofactor-independent phosphoglycerate mutase [Bacteroidaceae bacterium]
MKRVIILGDGMADWPMEELGGKTPLEYANTPYMDMLARNGRCGMLKTIPDGFAPGSEVANTAILGYDLNEVYEGRGPLEAASIGYDMQPDDMAIRCNIIALENGKIKNHHGNHLTTEQGRALIELLDSKLGSDHVRFIPGIQYRHLLVIKGGNKHVTCCPPHDHPNEEWQPLMPKADNDEVLSTVDLLNDLILKSQQVLNSDPSAETILSIWPWSPGYRPSMVPLTTTYPQIKQGSVITAVDLIRGIGKYAGLKLIDVEGATGLYDTNYEGKAQAAIDALKTDDFVFVHLEGIDEAGHDGDVNLKLRTIEDLDSRIVKPIYEAYSDADEPLQIAVLPDHLTPVSTKTHVGQPVPFLIYYKGIEPDEVQNYGETSCREGAYGLVTTSQFFSEIIMGK